MVPILGARPLDCPLGRGDGLGQLRPKASRHSVRRGRARGRSTRRIARIAGHRTRNLQTPCLGQSGPVR